MRGHRATLLTQVLALVLLGATGLLQVHAQTVEELASFKTQLLELHKQRKYADAALVAERYLAAARKRYGEEHFEVAEALSWQAFAHNAQGRPRDAEPLYIRSLAIYEKAVGRNHPAVATALSNLGDVQRNLGHLADADVAFSRSLAIRETATPPDQPSIAQQLSKLGALRRDQGKYADAEQFFTRSIATFETAVGPNHPDLAVALSGMAILNQYQGRLLDAERHFRRMIEITEKSYGPDHVDTAMALGNVAGFYQAAGRLKEAETTQLRQLAIFEKALSGSHPRVGIALNNLARLYSLQGRFIEAEPIFKRGLDIIEKGLGPDHREAAVTVGNLASLYVSMGRLTEADVLRQRELTIFEKIFPANHPLIATAHVNMGDLLRAQKRYDQAEVHFQRALSIRESALGPDHPDLAASIGRLGTIYDITERFGDAEQARLRALQIFEKALPSDHSLIGAELNNLAQGYRSQGRYAEAENSFMRSLAISRKTLGDDHPRTAGTINNMAALHFEQSDWRQAVELWQESTAISVRRSEREGGTSLTGRTSTEVGQLSIRFWSLVKASYRLSTPDRDLGREAFVTAQLAQSSKAAASLSQMAVRTVKEDAKLGPLIRERQDLVAEWQALDQSYTIAIGKSTDKRDAKSEADTAARLKSIDARVEAIEQTLRRDFPEFAALSSAQPLDIPTVQAQLGADEALVLFLDTPDRKPTPEETFVWVVTKSDVRWSRSELGTKALTERVAALRCGLDQAAWDADGGARCAGLLNKDFSPADATAGKPLPFDLARAHDLYHALFGQAEDLMKGKHLLIVPSGPLTAIPFQALITDKPAAYPADSPSYPDAAWFAKRHAITVLPSVASLKALRQFAKASKATQPFIGFGNPLLTGPSGTDRRAWEQQSCAGRSAPMQVASRGARGTIPKFFRSGLANVEEVRAQHPLPETADELCAVARSSGAPESAVYLGQKSTETTIKALSANGGLAQARYIHFATHGLLAGETEIISAGNAEPALILSPPEKETEADDGLLTASEIAQLKLDADWVILSACNTAAGESDKPGAETLSGLARAFFYAGARALLVSHWAVNSDATVKLITKAFDELKANPGLGRAEALRRSMLALVGTEGYSHPALWGPFLVVGEGSR